MTVGNGHYRLVINTSCLRFSLQALETTEDDELLTNGFFGFILDEDSGLIDGVASEFQYNAPETNDRGRF